MKKVLRFPDLNLKVKIEQYSSPESPRSWDNLGICAFFHSRYSFGDKGHGIDSNDYNDFAEMEKDLRKNHDAVIVLPVYMYDHSGQTISTKPFSCNWDSGQLGVIFATRTELLSEYGNGKNRLTKAIKDKATTYLEGEIETLDQYIKGDVYGFTAKNTQTKEEDSCWGFYGDTADNGIFDHIATEGLTKEMWETAYEDAEWKY